MGNIERRLSRLERQTGGATYFVVIRPGETEDQAEERYFAEFPERRSGRLVFFVIKGSEVGPSDSLEMGAGGNISISTRP